MVYVRDSSVPTLINFAVCDDIRAERDNKLTLVGYYGTSMNVGAIPGTLPKLCFLAQFAAFPRAERLRFRILSPSGSVVMETPEVQVAASDPANPVPEPYRQSLLIFQIAPMNVTEQGPYRVEFIFADSAPVATGFYIALPPA